MKCEACPVSYRGLTLGRGGGGLGRVAGQQLPHVPEPSGQLLLLRVGQVVQQPAAPAARPPADSANTCSVKVAQEVLVEVWQKASRFDPRRGSALA